MTRVASILFWFGLTLVVSLALYGTSNRVQDLSKQLRSLNAQIEAEQANIHVLKAEWVYLANPTRIETAARKYLSMHPTAMKQIASLDNLPEILPTRQEAMAGVTVRGKPIASVGTTLPARQVAATTQAPKMAAQDDSAHINTSMTLQSENEPSVSAQADDSATYNENTLLMAESESLPVADTTP